MEINIPVAEFNDALWNRFHNGKIRNVYPLIKYKDIIEKIKAMEANPPCNTPGEYYLLRKFIVVIVDGKERLSCRPENCVITENSVDQGTTKFYVALEEIYNYLDEAHKWVRHGCRDKIVRKIQNQGIVNITRETVELFLSFCRLCRPKRQVSRKISARFTAEEDPQNKRVNNSAIYDVNIQNGHVNSPSLRNQNSHKNKIEVNQNSQTHTVSFTRGFIDLIDYSLTPDGDYRYLFLYLDVQTCFCVLHPVRCKCTFEIVSHLLSVFTLLGPPQVLHSNFENSFLATIISELKQSLPELVLVSSSMNYLEIQKVAQTCISEVNSMLKLWMFETSSSRWSYGLKLIQMRKNNTLPSNSTKSPYECFFGRCMGSNVLSFTDLASSRSATKEDDLLILINEQSLCEQQSCEQLQMCLDPDICTLVQNHSEENNQMSETEQVQSPNIKPEPFSDHDSSNDVCSSPVNVGNLEQQSCEQLQVCLDPDICTLVQNDVEGSTQMSETEQVQSPIIKPEPFSDPDSSNDVCSSPVNVGNLEIVIKHEPEEDS